MIFDRNFHKNVGAKGRRSGLSIDGSWVYIYLAMTAIKLVVSWPANRDTTHRFFLVSIGSTSIAVVQLLKHFKTNLDQLQ